MKRLVCIASLLCLLLYPSVAFADQDDTNLAVPAPSIEEPATSVDDPADPEIVDPEDEPADVYPADPVADDPMDPSPDDPTDPVADDPEEPVTGWVGDGAEKRYISPETGEALSGGIFEIDGDSYCFDEDGALVFGWVAADDAVYYFDPATGAMVTNCEKLIEGLAAPLSAADGSSFADTGSQTPHAEDIDWVYETGISTGWVSADGTRTFKPLATLVRQDMAAFLYRLAGSPEFVADENDASAFVDVTPETPHATEIWWLARMGISEGFALADGTRAFRPLATLVRQDMAAFLYRLAGSPDFEPSDEEAAFFADVTDDTPHADEVRWLASVGVSEGWLEADETRAFRPLDTVKRADMAAFLHRMVSLGVMEPSAKHNYLFDESGALVTGWVTADGSERLYDAATGTRVDAGWGTDGTSKFYIDPESGDALVGGPHEIAGFNHIFDDDGSMLTGWVDVDGSRRYFGTIGGSMFTDGIHKIGGDTYCFADDGSLRLGLVVLDNGSYFFDTVTGKMKTGAISVNGTTRYFDRATGRMISFVTSGNAQLDNILWTLLDRFGYNGETSLRALYDWVGNYNNFPYVSSSWTPSGTWQSWSINRAIAMYNNRSGNCYGYASLTCWFARALGYDAKTIAGVTLFSGGWGSHGWVEVNLNGSILIIDTQQHAAPRNVSRNFFLVDYDHAPIYYRKL